MHTAGATQAPRAGVVLGTHRWQRVCVQRRALHLLAQYGVVVMPAFPIPRAPGMTIPTTDRSYCSLSAVYSIAHRSIHSRHQSAQQADQRDEQNPNPVENMLHVFTLPRPARPVKNFYSSCLFFLEIPFTLFFRPRNSS